MLVGKTRIIITIIRINSHKTGYVEEKRQKESLLIVSEKTPEELLKNSNRKDPREYEDYEKSETK